MCLSQQLDEGEECGCLVSQEDLVLVLTEADGRQVTTERLEALLRGVEEAARLHGFKLLAHGSESVMTYMLADKRAFVQALFEPQK
jgi:hypothetical protein